MAFGHLSPGRGGKLASLAPTLLALITVCSLAASINVVFAAQVTVAWDPNTDPGLAGYKLYWGTASGNYSWYDDAGDQTSYAVPNLSEGATYYFAATAYDGAGYESGFSTEVTYSVPSTCTYAISPASQSFGAGGSEEAKTTVTTGTACTWTTSSNSAWISIKSGAGGKGSGTVVYSVAANTGAASRTAGLTIAGRILGITQAGGQQPYTVTSTADPGGSISPSGAISVNPGGSQTFTITPATGNTIADVKVNGISVGPVASYTFSNVTRNHAIAASFNGKSYFLRVAESGSGTGRVVTNPSGGIFKQGTSVTLTAVADEGSAFIAWSGACSGMATTCTVLMTHDIAVTATFNSIARYSSSTGQ